MKQAKNSGRYSHTRLQLIKADYKLGCLKTLVDSQDEEILAKENEISAMVAQLDGLREINTVTRQELQKAMTEYTEYAKEFEKEKEGAGQAGQTL